MFKWIDFSNSEKARTNPFFSALVKNLLAGIILILTGVVIVYLESDVRFVLDPPPPKSPDLIRFIDNEQIFELDRPRMLENFVSYRDSLSLGFTFYDSNNAYLMFMEFFKKMKINEGILKSVSRLAFNPSTWRSIAKADSSYGLLHVKITEFDKVALDNNQWNSLFEGIDSTAGFWYTFKPDTTNKSDHKKYFEQRPFLNPLDITMRRLVYFEERQGLIFQLEAYITDYKYYRKNRVPRWEYLQKEFREIFKHIEWNSEIARYAIRNNTQKQQNIENKVQPNWAEFKNYTLNQLSDSKTNDIHLKILMELMEIDVLGKDEMGDKFKRFSGAMYYTHYNEMELLSGVGVAYIKLEKPDSAVIYLHKALSMAKDLKANKANKLYGTILNNLGSAYKKLQRWEIAENYLRESVRYNRSLQGDSAAVLAYTYFHLGGIMQARSQADSMRYYAEKAAAIAEKHQIPDLLNQIGTLTREEVNRTQR